MSVYYKENPAFLKRSIESVMNQTMKPNDIVLVCDGPLTDELYSAIDELKKHYKCLNTIQLDKNQGLGVALSIGINHTINEIVMRMDSDDVCLPDRAENELPFMNQYDLVGGHITEFENEEDNLIGYRKTPETYKQIYKFAKKRNPFNHPTVMFKKSAVLAAGNYQSLPYLEDYYLWVRFLKINTKVYNVQKVLVNMRSGREMRMRRSSRQSRASIKFLRKYMLKEKMINVFQYCSYTFLHVMFLLMPLRLRHCVYNKLHKQ